MREEDCFTFSSSSKTDHMRRIENFGNVLQTQPNIKDEDLEYSVYFKAKNSGRKELFFRALVRYDTSVRQSDFFCGLGWSFYQNVAIFEVKNVTEDRLSPMLCKMETMDLMVGRFISSSYLNGLMENLRNIQRCKRCRKVEIIKRARKLMGELGEYKLPQTTSLSTKLLELEKDRHGIPFEFSCAESKREYVHITLNDGRERRDKELRVVDVIEEQKNFHGEQEVPAENMVRGTICKKFSRYITENYESKHIAVRWSSSKFLLFIKKPKASPYFDMKIVISNT